MQILRKLLFYTYIMAESDKIATLYKNTKEIATLHMLYDQIGLKLLLSM